jgi:hypothetical protein
MRERKRYTKKVSNVEKAVLRAGGNGIQTFSKPHAAIKDGAPIPKPW